MAGSLGSLTIDLAANITRFERSLTRAERLATKRSKSIQRTFTRMATGIGAALASFGFVRAIDNSLDFADAIGKTADKLGITTDALQEYRFAAEQTGVAQSALDVGIQRFTRRLGEAQEGTGVLSKVLEGLNIGLKDNEGRWKSTDAVLAEYADAIKNADNSQQQLLLTFKAFDTEGAALVNLFRQGAEGITKFRNQAQSLGIIMSEDLIRNAEQASDDLNILSKVIRINLTEALVSLAPHISSAAQGIVTLATGFSSFLDSFDESASARIVENIVRIREEIDLAELAVQRASAREDDDGFDFFGLMQSSETAQVALDELLDKLLAAELKLGEVNLRIVSRMESEEGEQGERRNFITGLTPEEMQADYDLAVSMGSEMTVLFQKNDQARLRSEMEVAQLVTNSRMNAMQNAIGFLQVLGKKNKTAAMAALILQKGLAIAQVVVSTQAASMRAMADLGPVAGAAAVAGIQAMGATSIGLIAATGLLQAHSMNTSGSTGGISGGSVADPFVTTDSNQFLSTETAQTGTITINVNGVVTEEILQDLIIPAIQDSIDNKDVILFRNDSRQALELTA